MCYAFTRSRASRARCPWVPAGGPIHRRRTQKYYITLIVCRLIVVIHSIIPRVNCRPQNHVRDARAKAPAPERALAGEARRISGSASQLRGWGGARRAQHRAVEYHCPRAWASGQTGQVVQTVPLTDRFRSSSYRRVLAKRHRPSELSAKPRRNVIQ